MEEPPEPPRLRFLRRLVILLTGLLLAAMIVAMTAIFVKLATDSPGDAASDSAPYATLLPLAAGETLRQVEVERGLIYLRLQEAASGAARVVVVRAASGVVLGEVDAVPPPATVPVTVPDPDADG